MRNTLFAFFTAVFVCSAMITAASAQGTDPELQALIKRVNEKKKAGTTTEADLAGELKAFDALIAKHNGEKTEQAALTLFTKAVIYRDFLSDDIQCYTLLTQVSSNYPDTKMAEAARMRLDRAKGGDKLVIGTNFPDFFVRDMAGRPLGLANYRGDVVLIDFWASWSEPCTVEAAALMKIHEAHHTGGFEIIGINLDKDSGRMEGFLTANKMAWPQIFDEGQHDSKIAPQCKLTKIPMNFLLDREGKIIARDLHGDELQAAVAQAVAKK